MGCSQTFFGNRLVAVAWLIGVGALAAWTGIMSATQMKNRCTGAISGTSVCDFDKMSGHGKGHWRGPSSLRMGVGTPSVGEMQKAWPEINSGIRLLNCSLSVVLIICLTYWFLRRRRGWMGVALPICGILSLGALCVMAWDAKVMADAKASCTKLFKQGPDADHVQCDTRPFLWIPFLDAAFFIAWSIGTVFVFNVRSAAGARAMNMLSEPILGQHSSSSSSIASQGGKDSQRMGHHAAASSI